MSRFSSPPVNGEIRDTIAWMVHNRVTPNILMMTLLVGGFYMTTRIKQEVFPSFDLDTVTVMVPYPGASPEEVEQGILLATEEAVRGLEGVKQILSRAYEGGGSVTVELMEGMNRQKVYQDIQQEVERIDTFPDDAEDPVITLNVHKRGVLDVQIYGDVDEWVVRETAEQVRDMLLQDPGITQVELSGAKEYEIHIEISQEALRRHKLTLNEVTEKVRRSAVEIPGGKITTVGGEVLLRVTERKDWAEQFRRIPVISAPNGVFLRLEDIASVREGFEDTDHEATFDGLPAVGITVYEIGDQTPMGVANAVRSIMPDIERELPLGVEWTILNDRSQVYKQRLGLLLKNAFLGLTLVLVLLGIFLEMRLAFWVTLGIPISFLGGMLFIPIMDVSINMMSMFAFIVALGIVVDDAIVAGENIYEYRQRGMPMVEAAIQGARDITMPITFSILTNIVAFIPMYFVPGIMGKIWGVIPLVVCTVFIISLVEAVWILPSHLAHASERPRRGVMARLHRLQSAFSQRFALFVEKVYGPFLYASLRYKTLTLSIGVSVLILTVAYVSSGRLGFILMPKVESDVSVVTAVLPPGSPMERARVVRRILLESGQALVEENGGTRLSEGTFAVIRDNTIEARIYLTPPKVRPISTSELTSLWRERVGEVPGLESLIFESDRGGPGGGAGLTLELSHRDIDILERASEALAHRLGEFSVLKDIDDGYMPGKQQLNFRVTHAGENLGLTAREIALQVRHAFQGQEAIKQQRGRNEVTIRIRRPESERVNEFDLETMLLRTPGGGFVPLMDVASVERGRAYTMIHRRNGRRTVTVTANVDPMGEVSRVREALDKETLPALMYDFPGLTCSYEGRQADLAESFQALMRGMMLALLVIYVLLAIPFRSYGQPIVVMMAIPFGIVGATLGHLIMGYNLSIISIMGIVALAGVVVNDSLVLIDYSNRLRRERGLSPLEAVGQAGIRRFRPILLTTLTTFGGLSPMIFETSRQARFMIPMAISLGFGILFATVISLVLVPNMYLLFEDIKSRMDGYVLSILGP